MSLRISLWSDPVTRTTRLAAIAAAVAVVAWALLFAVTTQLKVVRAASPFADDPWDGVASFAMIGLAVVVAATGVRSLRHREPILPVAIAARIRLGAGIALGIIAVNVLSDALALGVVPLPEASAATDGRLALIADLVGLTADAVAVAGALLLRADRVARRFPAGSTADAVAPEPDVLDDALGLTDDVLAHVPVVAGPGRRLVALVARALDQAPVSPRRHRMLFGLLVALAAGVAFAAWHAIREGPWVTPLAPLLFVVLVGTGVLVAYLVTLRPLRLIRPV